MPCLYALNDISAIDWQMVYSETDMQNAFSLFHSKLVELYHKHFPKQKITYKYNNRKHWISQALKEGIKNKNKLYSKYNRIKYVANEIKYKTYRNKLNRILKVAERKYYSDMIDENKHNIKKTWQIIKNIVNKNVMRKYQSKFKLSDGSITCDKSIISEKFNEFFTGIGPSLAKKIPKQTLSPLNYLGNPIIQSFFLSEVTTNEIDKIIQSLKNGAAGHGDITAVNLKLVARSINQPLAYHCNLSFTQGVFSNELKLANVLPLYKSEDPYSFNNYRPVSLLCVLSKVFEKVMYDRLLEFLEIHKLLFAGQFGFRKQHSSYMTLTILMDKLISSLDKGEMVIGIFLDFSKAFDTVDREIQKLFHYGVRGCALDWFKSYLCGRKQYVIYNNVSSNTKIINCGVPQGSILGPLLFLIYINDLSKVCTYTTPILFADDTNIFLNGLDIKQMQNIINKELLNISNWLKANKLSLNVKKTHYMIFTRNRHIDTDITLSIDGEPIYEVQKTKFLGEIIDKKLTWKEHITLTAGKISRGIGMVIKARNYLNKSGLITIYYFFIYPYLTYCNHIWGCTYKTNLQRLVTLQNRIVRIISHAKARDSSHPLYTQLGIMKFSDLNTYLIARFMFRYAKASVPDSFGSLFQRNNEYHNHETRSADHFHIPVVTSDLGKTGIRFRGAIIWNAVLCNNVNTDVSEAVYAKFLQRLINENVLPWIDGRMIIMYLESTQPCNHHFEQICWSHNEYFTS